MRSIELLADPRRRVLALGGRVSAFLARYLASQLHLIRPGVELIDPERSNPADHLVDLGRRDILVRLRLPPLPERHHQQREGRGRAGEHRRRW